MKNLILLSAFLIFACSSDDSSDSNDNNDNNVTENSLLCVKRTLITDFQYREYSYSYAGTQLIGYNRKTIRENYTDNESTTFTYTNNVITAGITAIEVDGEFVPTTYYSFEYDEFDRKIKVNYTDVNGNITSYYTLSYLQNGSVQEIREDGTLSVLYLYDDLGRLYQTINYDQNGQLTGVGTLTFDDKNSPFKNVTIWNPLSFLTASNFINNIRTEDYNGCISEYDIIYNNDNYPTSIEKTNCDGEIVFNEMYEYITL